MFKRRNEVESLFRWFKGFTRVSSRSDKFDEIRKLDDETLESLIDLKARGANIAVVHWAA